MHGPGHLRELDGIVRVTSAVAATLMLLAPALWNGFPLLEYDTGGYLARWFEETLEVSRSTVYGSFVVALSWPNLWPVVVAQAALTVWLIALMLRVHGVGARPFVLLATVALLSLATSLSWIASTVLTDIFAGGGVLALYLLLLRAEKLAGWEQGALIALATFSAATHNATLAVLLCLLLAAAIVRVFYRRLVPIAGLLRGVVALAFAPILLVTANYAVAGRLAWTPGGVALSFGRLLQDGIVARFLADHCPDRRFKLCSHRKELPTDADVFFWGESVFDRLGRFEGLDEEMRMVVVESLRAYPLWQIGAAVSAASRQLVTLRTGEGINNSVWHTYNMIEMFTPSMLSAMREARQQRGELDFRTINYLHVPVALASMVLLAGVMMLALRRPYLADLGLLAGAIALAILANAAVCGVLANPHDRYGARMAWLATSVVAIVAWRLANGGLRRLALPRAGS